MIRQGVRRASDGRRTPSLRAPGRYALLIVGLLTLCQAVILSVDPDVWLPDEAIIHRALPVSVRATIWAATGALAVVASLHRKWHPVGWIAVTIMPALRCFSWTWSGLAWLVPGEPGGRPEAFAQAFWYGLWIVLLMYLASTPTLADAIENSEDR